MVEPKEYFHHCVAALRAAVNPGALGTENIISSAKLKGHSLSLFSEKLLISIYFADYVPKTAIPLKEAFGDRYVQGRVVSLDTEGRRVRLESCTVLYCTVLYCTVLYCTVLYCR